MANIEIPKTSTETINAIIAADKFLNKDITLIASSVLVTDSSRKITTTSTNASKLAYLNSVNADIQTQINDRATSVNPVFTGTMLIGASSQIRFQDSRFTAFNGETTHTYAGKLGITGEACSDSDQTSCGIGGNAMTYGSNKARGIVGVAKVGNTTDTAEAIGVEARSNDAHASGNNIAFQADAIGGNVNYSFEGKNGLMLNKDSITSGDGTNNCTIDSTTGLKLNGTTTNYKDLFPTQFITSPINGASATMYNGNIAAYELVKNATKAVQAMFQLNHDYKEGSNITPHLHLYIQSAIGNQLKLTIEYTWTNIGDTGAVTVISTPVIVTGIAESTVNNNFIFSFGAINGENKTISSIFTCRVRRDANDADSTIDASVFIKSFDLHYEVDTIGSREMLTK